MSDFNSEENLWGCNLGNNTIEGVILKLAHAPGDQLTLRQGERHRLVGLAGWGVVAEIWQHTDANEPSNEDDIVRVQDDFGR